MDQIPQSIINSLLGGSLAALGWFARQIRCRPPADIMRTECLKTKSPTSNDGAFRAITPKSLRSAAGVRPKSRPGALRASSQAALAGSQVVAGRCSCPTIRARTAAWQVRGLQAWSSFSASFNSAFSPSSSAACQELGMRHHGSSHLIAL